VPAALRAMLVDPDTRKVKRLTEALMKMGKLEIEPLTRAFTGA
jgi:hypothetical protein